MRCLIERWRRLALNKSKCRPDAKDGHLEKCPECRAFVESEGRLLRALAAPGSEPAHSPGLHRRIMASVRAAAEERQRPFQQWPFHFLYGRPTALAGALSALIIGGLLLAFYWKPIPVEHGELAQIPSVEVPPIQWNMVTLARERTEALLQPLEVEYEQVQSDLRRLAEFGWVRWANFSSDSASRHELR
jgi:hypothetical protein